jgi:hypothetical protein
VSGVRGSLTCRQGDVAIEAALVDAVTCVVAAHDGRRCAVALLVAQPHAAVALGAIGFVRALIACEGRAEEEQRVKRAGDRRPRPWLMAPPPASTLR